MMHLWSARRHNNNEAVQLRRILVFVLLALVMVLLSACSFETHIYIQGSEHWKVEEQLMLPKHLGNIGTKVKGIGIGIPLSTDKPITALYDQITSICPQYNWKCTVHKSSRRNEVQYKLIVKGQGYESLSRFFNISSGIILSHAKNGNANVTFSNFVVKREGKQVHILFNGIMNSDSKTATIMRMLFPIKIAIHGRKIIQANADEIQNGTAVWYSPRGIDVTLEPSLWLLGVPLRVTTAIAFFIVLSFLSLMFLLYSRTRFSKRPSVPVEDSSILSDIGSDYWESSGEDFSDSYGDSRYDMDGEDY